MTKKKEYYISMRAVKKIAREVGCERISNDALLLVRSVLEQWAKSIFRRSLELAKHAKRKTVMKKDVERILKKSKKRK